MKTNFRKEINHMQDDFNVDEATILEDLDIDTEHIVNTVMNNIHTAAPKKRIHKLPLILIAAALSAAVIGTTVLAATGVLTPFSQKFNGDTSALTVYENNSFRFHSSDENLQASFSGLVGDEEFTLAAVEITKKDGSIFTEDDGILSAKISPSQKGYTYRVDHPAGYQSSEGTNYHSDSIEYYLSEDKKTLTVYMTVETGGENVKGTKVQLNSREIYTYKLGKKQDEQQINSSLLPKKFQPSPGTLWKYENGKYSIYQIESAPVLLPFEISFELDRKLESNMKFKLSAENAPNVMKENHEATITVSPFKMTLDYHKSYSEEEIKAITKSSTAEAVSDYSIFDDKLSPYVDHSQDGYRNGSIHTLQSGLLMKDGTEYFFAEIENGTAYDAPETHTLEVKSHKTLFFTDYPYDSNISISAGDDLHCTVVDPSKIAKIIINNDVVYTAEGYESTETSVVASPLFHVWSSKALQSIFDDEKLPLDGCSFTHEFEHLYNSILHKQTITTTFAGNKDQLLSLISRIEREKNNSLLINNMKVFNSDSHKYEVEMELINVYMVEANSNFKKIQKHISKTYPSYHWSEIMKNYLENHQLPDSSVPFEEVNDNLIIPVKEEPSPTETPTMPVAPSNPVAEPERAPLIEPDFSNFRSTKWNVDEIKKRIASENNLSVSSVDKTTDNSNHQFFDLQFTATKNEVCNLVNTLSKFEEENLFVTDVKMNYAEENNGTYETTIRLINPEISSSDEAIKHFGVTAKSKALAALFDDIKGEKVESLWVVFSDHSVTANLEIQHQDFVSFIDFKDALSENGKYKMSENLNVEKRQSYYHGDVNLYSYEFQR